MSPPPATFGDRGLVKFRFSLLENNNKTLYFHQGNPPSRAHCSLIAHGDGCYLISSEKPYELFLFLSPASDFPEPVLMRRSLPN